MSYLRNIKLNKTRPDIAKRKFLSDPEIFKGVVWHQTHENNCQLPFRLDLLFQNFVLLKPINRRIIQLNEKVFSDKVKGRGALT